MTSPDHQDGQLHKEAGTLPEIKDHMDIRQLADACVSVLQKKTKLDLSREAAADEMKAQYARQPSKEPPSGPLGFRKPAVDHDFGRLLPNDSAIQVTSKIEAHVRHVIEYEADRNDTLRIRRNSNDNTVYIHGTHIEKGVNYAFTLKQQGDEKTITLLKDGNEIQGEGFLKWKKGKNELVQKHLTAVLDNVPTL